MIVPQKLTFTKVTSAAKKSITFAWKRDALADGYQLQISTVKDFSKITKSAIIKKNTTVKGTLSGFTSGKTYYVRIRAYKTIDRVKKASAFGAVKTVRVK